MNQANFKKASEKISEIVLMAEQRVAIKHINSDVAECYGKLLLKYARELIAAADENEPTTETSCSCDEDYFGDEDDGIAHATLRTAQIKSIDFSDDGVTTINMRHGDPIIFKDISEVMFIS